MDKTEKLDAPIIKIFEGISDFNKVVETRLSAKGYTKEHLLKLNLIRKKLIDIQSDIISL